MKKTLQKSFNKKTTGSAYGIESLDGSFFYFKILIEKKKAHIINSSLGPEQFIVVASEPMKELLSQAPNPIQADTIEGFVESVYFKGEMNFTMTSTWCPIRNTQIPVLITILMNKEKKSYKIHWKHFFEISGENLTSIEEFFDFFPGNTSDFSDSIRIRFNMALDEYTLEKYGDALTEVQKSQMYRYCEVHFETNLKKASRIAAAVDPSKRLELKFLFCKILLLTFRKVIVMFTE